ncbi:type IV pilus secretin PilQ [Myxococcota bacterium]|nr:type IV pilus secretin PilQ [Myxococcota bacterium]
MVVKSRSLNGWFALATALLFAILLSPRSAAAAPSNELLGIDLQDSASALKVRIRTASRPDSTTYRMSEPLRVIVELRDTGIGATRPLMSVNNGTLYEVRAEQIAAADGVLTRVVLYLDAVKDFVAVPGEDGVAVDLLKGSTAASGDAIASAIEGYGGGTSSAEPGRFDPEQLSSVQGDHAFPGYQGGVTRILGIDFQNRPGSADVSHVVITGDDQVDYEAARQGDREVVVRVRNARLGTGLERALDTSRFPSGIERVTAYQDRRRKDEVRVVIDLSEPIEPTVTRSGKDLEIVTLEFAIPPAIAASRAEAGEAVAAVDQSAPPPAAAPAPRAESAVGREKLVSGGRSLDPASALKVDEGLFGREDGLILEGRNDWSGRRINMDLVNADIHNVFRLISHVSKLNIVSSDEVKGTVTVRLIDVPWDQALAAILQAKGLGASQFGNIIRVAAIETIRAEKEEAVQAQKATVSLLPLSILTLPLNYAQAKDMEAQVKAVLSERGTVAKDERTNTLIVKDIQEGIVRARELVLALDTQTPQVSIKARIVEANQSWSRALGIQWGGNLNFSRSSGSPTGLYFPNDVGVSGGNSTGILSGSGSAVSQQGATTFSTAPTWVVDLPVSNSAGSLAIALGSITDTLGLDVRLSAIEAAGEGRVISSPSVIAATNEKATIEQGSKIPYVTSSLRGTQTQFADATLKLDVTPQITADRNVILEMEITKNTVDFGQTVAGLPTIEVKEVSTTAMVKDGETTVIGGVYSVDESSQRTYIPGLGEIPILGALFKQTSKNSSRKELLVFITPTILTASLPRQTTLDAGEVAVGAAGGGR